VGKDPEIRVTQDGKEIATLSVATTEGWTDKSSGEKKNRTEWHKVVIFNPSAANFVKQYVHKGSKVFVEGQLQTRKWTDAAGLDRYTTEVQVQGYNGNITLLDKADKAQDSDTYEAVKSGGYQLSETDDEIPFTFLLPFILPALGMIGLA
jgi:single-strand DNA-binding protein